MVRILLVEDERKVAAFVRTGLEEEGFLVDWAPDGTDALERTLRNSYDLILLDVRLPDISGVEICHRMRLHGVVSPIMMLTALDAIEDRVSGLRAGADDYLPKPFAFDELIARIDALLRRSRLHDEGIAYSDGLLTLDPVARSSTFDGNPVPLTPKEFDLLAYFLARQGKALRREDIHRDVWGNRFDRGTNLIDVYVGYIRSKLADAGCTSQIDAVRSIGYRYVSRAADESNTNSDSTDV
ncbi:MAG: response regulator transcription factor [Rhodothermales bacterium]|nr:response regulator transcription factor [Rhodothermales bacterium]